MSGRKPAGGAGGADLRFDDMGSQWDKLVLMYCTAGVQKSAFVQFVFEKHKKQRREASASSGCCGCACICVATSSPSGWPLSVDPPIRLADAELAQRTARVEFVIRRHCNRVLTQNRCHKRVAAGSSVHRQPLRRCSAIERKAEPVCANDVTIRYVRGGGRVLGALVLPRLRKHIA